MPRNTGQGVAKLEPLPSSDLSDATWRHGSSDVRSLRDCAPKTSMRPYGDRMALEDIRNVINDESPLGPNPLGSH